MTSLTPSFSAPAASVLLLSRKRIGNSATLTLLVLAAALLAVALAQLVASLAGADRFMAACCALAGTLPPALLLGKLVLDRLEPTAVSADPAAMPRDELTGLMPRGLFVRALEREWQLARRHRSALSIVLIDLDHLKRINDAYGKRCGDEVLRRVAVSCSRVLRGGDVLARFGGEEFIILLPQTDPLGALDMADRLRERIAKLDFDWLGHAIKIQASVGVASLRDEHALVDQLLLEADQALQQAKTAGRNCVRALDEAPVTTPTRVR